MWVKAILLFFVFSFLFRTDLSFDQDLGRHIKLGEIIWQTKQIPKVNLFSYTNPDFPFINTHWLFEVIAYFFAATGTLQLFLILKIIIFLISVWLIMKGTFFPAEIKNVKSSLLLPVGFIFFHVLRERLELRPEIFSFLFTALTYYILERKKPLFLLPVIALIWINTHIYFFVGFLLQAIYLRKKLHAIILGLSILVSLINPNGLSGLLYPLNVTKNYGYTIVENQTMNLLESINFRDPNFLFVKLSIGLVALSIAVALIRKNFNIKNILLALSGVGLALMNVRSFPYLVFLSFPATLSNFGNIKLKFLIPIFALLLTLESFFYLNGDYYKYTGSQHQRGLRFVQSGRGALDFVLANDLPGPIYNNFDIGSYIIYRAYPKYQVFVDGRPEAYSAAFFTNVYIPTQSDYSKFKELENKWGFKTIIFSHTDQTPWGKAFLQSIVKDQEWRIVYIDDFMIVLTKEEGLPQINLGALSPNQFKFEDPLSYLQLGIFLYQTGNIDAASQFISISNPPSQKFFW